jgi:hypothetical protein
MKGEEIWRQGEPLSYILNNSSIQYELAFKKLLLFSERNQFCGMSFFERTWTFGMALRRLNSVE